MDAIARERGLDPLDVRKANLLRAGFDRTPYDQTVEDLRDAARDHRGARGLERLSRPARADRRLQCDEPDHQAGHRADAGDVRHLVHADPAQSGGRAGACLFRRLDPSQPRRHGDGAGAVHQGRAGRGGRVRRAAAFRAHNRDQHRQGSQRLADRRVLRDRPQRHGGENRRRRDPGADDGLRRRGMERRAGGGRVPRRRACSPATCP